MMTTHGKGHGQRPAFGAGIGKNPCRQMTFLWLARRAEGKSFRRVELLYHMNPKSVKFL